MISCLGYIYMSLFPCFIQFLYSNRRNSVLRTSEKRPPMLPVINEDIGESDLLSVASSLSSIPKKPASVLKVENT